MKDTDILFDPVLEPRDWEIIYVIKKRGLLHIKDITLNSAGIIRWEL
jgi:hypothetical protein